MKAGAAQFIIPAVEAYGEYKEEAIETLPKEQFAGIENLRWYANTNRRWKWPTNTIYCKRDKRRFCCSWF